MRWRDRLGALAGLAFLFVAIAAPTYPRDDSGATAAVCAWVDTSGAAFTCDSSHPAPMTTVPAGTPAVDSTGFGRTWVNTKSTTSGAPFATGTGVAIGGLYLDQYTAVAFQSSAAGVTQFRSIDGGRTWFQVSPTAAVVGVGPLNAVGQAPDGSFLVGHGGVSKSANHSIWTNSPLTGYTPGNVSAFAASGGTTLAFAGDNSGSVKICRSTDNGSTFSCTTPVAFSAAFSQSNVHNGQNLTSPSSGVWLTTSNGTAGIETYRSADDGVTWTLVDSYVSSASPSQVSVVCVTNLICLQTDGRLIRRSTNAGVTWVNQLDTGVNNAGLVGFLGFGQSVVVAIASPATTTQPWYRSIDNGATWSQLVNPVCGTSSIAANVNAVANSGRGLVFVFTSATGTGAVCIYTSLPAGGGAYNGSGQQLVAEGDAAGGSLPAWQVAPVQQFSLGTAAATVSGVGASQTQSLTAATGQRICVRELDVFVSSGRGTPTLSVQNAGTGAILLNYGTLIVTTAASRFRGEPLMCGPTSASLNVIVGAAGPGLTTTLSIVWDFN